MRGGRDNDTINGDNCNDILHGGAGDDALYGDGGSDVLEGGKGDDALFGDNGDDVLSGGQGNDVMTGGAGADIFVFDLQAGHNIITDCVDGDDRLDLTALGVANAAHARAVATDHNGGVLFDLTQLGGSGSI